MNKYLRDQKNLYIGTVEAINPPNHAKKYCLLLNHPNYHDINKTKKHVLDFLIRLKSLLLTKFSKFITIVTELMVTEVTKLFQINHY